MVVAHAGHWLADLLYAVPLLAVLGVLAWQRVKARREGPRDQQEPADGG